MKKLDIELKDWEHNCGDGCCYTYGTDIYLNGQRLDDLTKVLCNVTGTDYGTIGTLHRFNYDNKDGVQKFKLETNTWFDWGFFQIKLFKKGTIHLKFKELEDWYRLNKAYGELKGFVLSEEYKTK